MKALEADLVYDGHKYQSGQYYTGTINLYPVYIIIVIICIGNYSPKVAEKCIFSPKISIFSKTKIFLENSFLMPIFIAIFRF